MNSIGFKTSYFVETYNAVKQLFNDINMIFIYMKCLVVTSVYDLYFRLSCHLAPLYVYKIYAYPYDELKDKVDLTLDFYDGYNIKPSNLFPRIEYRCKWKGKKYKLNSINSEVNENNNAQPIIPMLFPSRCLVQEPRHSPFCRKGVKRYIVEARLMDEKHRKDKDVTRQLLKYAGPNHDFFNQPILARWLIKDLNKEIEYSHLMVLFSDGHLMKYTMSETVELNAK